MLKEATGILSDDELAQVRARSDLWGLWGVVSCWGMIFGTMAIFAIWPNPLTFLLGIVIIGGRQLGLAVLMHDASHGIMCKTRWLNDFLGIWLCGNPTGVSMEGYRPYHLKHHLHTQQAEDPDLILSAAFPITRKSLHRKIIRDLTGQTFWKQRKAQVLNGIGGEELQLAKRVDYARTRLGSYLFMNALLFSGLTLAGHWYLYFVMWILPLATWNMMITRIRNMAEHAVMPDNNDPFRSARTTLTNPLTRLLIAPYGVNYHVEHHLFMWVPWYRLAKLHRILIAKGVGTRMEIQPGYGAVIELAASESEATVAA